MKGFIRIICGLIAVAPFAWITWENYQQAPAQNIFISLLIAIGFIFWFFCVAFAFGGNKFLKVFKRN